MSVASKAFFGFSLLVTGGTIWGVHYMQQQESDNMYQGIVKDEARLREKALKKVQQPDAVVDEDCVTCVISPPPQLLEAQTKEQRAIERQARLEEYEAQKALAQRLSQGQPAPLPSQPVQQEQRLV